MPRLGSYDITVSRLYGYVFFLVTKIMFHLDSSNLDIVPDLTTWLKGNTDIPIYLPVAWQPIMPSGNTQNYYYQMYGDEDSYSFNVYKINVPVKFNDEDDLLEKNRPVSEADFIGSISGERITDDSSGLSLSIPSDAENFELIPGLMAYYKDGVGTLWKQKG